MTGENQFSNPSFSDNDLEQAVKEIRHDDVNAEVVEAAAARVWSKLRAQAEEASAHAIRNCGDFQALIPEYRAGKLAPARVMLLEDHLHQCVACRRTYEGRVVPMPAARRRPAVHYSARWAAAAVVVAAAGISVWILVNQGGGRSGRAIVQGVNGTLFEVSASGIRQLAAGAALPEGVEIRTAPETDAVLQLRDGSVVEMRERSGMSADSGASDLTIHLTRGSLIVQAAKRSSGHLYVVTPACRVAVTGTLFGVTAGMKGSRVSVLEGEVRVSQENQEKVLHPGEQSVSGEGLEPEPVRDDIAWSRNHDRYYEILSALRSSIQQVPLPDLRYASRLIDRLPAATQFYAAVPNLGDYLASAESVLRGRMAENPELAPMKDSRGLALLDKLRAASGYLGDEVVIAGQPDAKGGVAWVFLAEVKHAGFAEFLTQNGVPMAMQSRNGLAVFGPDAAAVAQFAPALDTASGGFARTAFYRKIEEVYHDGAGLLFCVELPQASGTAGAAAARLGAPRYVLAQQKEVDHHMEASATLAFDHEREGIAAWLAPPAPMGSLEYFSPDAALAAAFVTRSSGVIVDEMSGVLKQFGGRMETDTAGLRDDLAAALGGEFALAVDGPVLPTPSWKLVVEVYDQARFQAALAKVVAAYDAYAAKSNGKPLRTGEETLDGRTYYMVAGGDPNPLTEAHYTFSDGYLIAAPSVALLKRAIETRNARSSLAESTRFKSLAPRDHYANFSAVVYQNLAPTVAPIAGLLEGFLQSKGQTGLTARVASLKPSLIAAYGAADRLTVATDQNVFGNGLTDLMTGNVAGMIGNLAPLPQFRGHGAPAYHYEGTPRR